MIVYVAGKYTADTPSGIAENVAAARKVAIHLWEAGYSVLTPHLNTIGMESDCKATYEDYMRGCIEMIARCDAVVMLPGWTDSKGAAREHAYAESIGVPLYYYPDLPVRPLTETTSPMQVKCFIETVMSMYRIHLQKNCDYCVAPHTKVLKADWTWVHISDLVVGDKLIGFTENAVGWRGKRKFVESVVQSVSWVKLPSYKLTLSDGEELISSSRHPWFIMSGCTARWGETEMLQESERFKNPSRLVRLFDTWETDQSHDSGYLAASLDGEGWLTHKENLSNRSRGHDNWLFTLGFAQKDNAMLAEVERILQGRGIKYRRKFAGSTEQIIFCDRRAIVELMGSIRPKRLLPKMKPMLGRVRHYPVALTKKEFIGETDLVSIQTSSKTYIANGIGSHNSPANILGTGWIGLVTRIWDKVARLTSLTGFRITISGSEFAEPHAPKNESIEDNLLDLANYAVIAKIFRQGAWGR